MKTMFNQLDILLKFEQQKDLLREAQAERLARLARAAQPARPSLHHRVLAALGRKMEALGARLVERFSDCEQALTQMAEHQPTH